MAENETQAGPYDPDVKYRFRVKRVAWLGAIKFLPRDENNRAPGSTLNRIIEENGPDAIAFAEPV